MGPIETAALFGLPSCQVRTGNRVRLYHFFCLRKVRQTDSTQKESARSFAADLLVHISSVPLDRKAKTASLPSHNPAPGRCPAPTHAVEPNRRISQNTVIYRGLRCYTLGAYHRDRRWSYGA